MHHAHIISTFIEKARFRTSAKSGSCGGGCGQFLKVGNSRRVGTVSASGLLTRFGISISTLTTHRLYRMTTGCPLQGAFCGLQATALSNVHAAYEGLAILVPSIIIIPQIGGKSRRKLSSRDGFTPLFRLRKRPLGRTFRKQNQGPSTLWHGICFARVRIYLGREFRSLFG